MNPDTTPTSPQAAELDEGPDRQELKLLLVAANFHLATPDIRSLLHTLKTEDCGFEVSLEIVDPALHPELLELHRLVATPALVKLEPHPKQVFAGNALSKKLRSWLPRWKQVETRSKSTAAAPCGRSNWKTNCWCSARKTRPSSND